MSSEPVPSDELLARRQDDTGALVERIVSEIKPRRVLEVGCAVGAIVGALRARGVEASGVELCEDPVAGSLRPFCRAAPAGEPFEDKFDLIVCAAPLHRLSEDETRSAIANMCRSTGDVLASWGPVDAAAPTPVPALFASWWIAQFEEHGFRLDVDFLAGSTTGPVFRFRVGPPTGTVVDTLLTQWHGLSGQLDTLRIEVAARDAATADLRATVADLRAEVTGLRQQGDDKDRLIAGLNYHLLAVQRTIGWKVLERVRWVRDRLLPPDSRRRDLYWQVRRPVEVLLDEGTLAFWQKTWHKIRLRWRGQKFFVKVPPHEAMLNAERQYDLWVERHQLTSRDVARMKRELETFAVTPAISVVTVVFNADETWLRRAVESVRAQIYPHWELCLVNDGSTQAHVRRVLDEYAAIEPRIRVKHLPRRHGMPVAWRHALDLASGAFVAILGQDDELPPQALFEVVTLVSADPDVDLVYTDEDKLDPDGHRVEPFFKPDWSPDLLLSMNYIGHLAVFRRSLLGEVDGLRFGFDGSEDYDLLLRFTERARRIGHVPKILYHWRRLPGSIAASTAARPFAFEAGREAIEEAVRRRGYEGRVESILPGLYAVRYKLTGTPLVSIIIPTRDRWSLLQQCLRSIEERTRYARYEIIVVDNDSTEPETLEGLQEIAGKWRVYPHPGPFNFSAINNFAATQARGEQFVFLNNDTQVVEPDWLTALLEHAQRPEVGAVGARLLYPDGRIQHAGLVLGLGGVADHAFKGLPGDTLTYRALANVVRNVSGVTAACMMVPRKAFEDIGGFDERLRVSFNDVDLCLRLRARGYLIVCTPFAVVYHHESSTRGRLQPPGEEDLTWTIWGDLIRKGDPYYNPNLTLSRTDWSLEV
ncbi:MAG TPA: glycosyltransferase [Candidatus Methylomirabilis sp.]|nr:glycosyltransferase [Candidatus Methylomirabilis sp.]